MVVEPGSEAAFLAPLAARKLWGVGPKSAARLEALGITTVGALAAAPLQLVAGTFGPRQARELQRHALGIDDSVVEEDRELKSISDETTFAQDEANARLLWRVLSEQCDECAARVARHGCLARTVTVKLRYADFTTITRSLSLPVPTDDPQAVRTAVAALMRHAWSRRAPPSRLIGVRLSGFTPRPGAAPAGIGAGVRGMGHGGSSREREALV